MINGDRLWNRLLELGTIGKQPSGGITRLSFTKEERAAKEKVASYMKEAGLAVYEDAVGNLIGRKEGKEKDAPAVLVGSHIDSVYNGGMFDGPLGVLAAVEVLQTMNERGVKTKHPIEVVAFTDEEGARFSYGMIGSRGMAGTLSEEELVHQDKYGISLAAAMEEAGLDPGKIGKAARRKGSVKAYVELHIEQGRVLEQANLPVGIVTGIAGLIWAKLTVKGKAEHAGATPMPIRRDPLVAAAQIIQVIEQEAKKTGTTVGTVGQMQVFPGGINIIPERVEFSLDLRDLDAAVRDSVFLSIIERAKQIGNERNVDVAVELLQKMPPVLCSELVQNAAKEACRQLGFDVFTLPSGASHDGVQLAGLCPIGMIFVRSKDGVSHSPEEWSSKEDCAAGANVLYHTVLSLAMTA
ncbi:Zn-dependent hydrolase [Parageobacillus thermoglucosidasius]|uniref:Zn-dependent hydrolase n=1 Tax=Parageobacillus thermoglucosidasius TaxID=1426 RepID=A0AAN0YLS1_PARTM|nr:Zn-dependent hydrolase [Parageobacillus thermoglucosidasius]ALF08889.1 allantoate amidohydrolase [Parageobacillus thermoglucosidasius]ANZ28971.1 Zn-dependent hydrolase [Parageobacillus thermoglucosidasius]APM79710.1 Zn-dependent hydrolase [Parageobacillus thermoglucosidasius]KJX69478.1 allantoate amidohydrolase [Parageobacillus thermoglucosidasius]RDE23160.1 Zn-dependent hydrolase [Parageobacillus thermoglucosidasius]